MAEVALSGDRPSSSWPEHPFYWRLSQLLIKNGFDEFVCARFNAEGPTRPSLPLATYFQQLQIGYIENIHHPCEVGMV